jgi:hypothetical protein
MSVESIILLVLLLFVVLMLRYRWRSNVDYIPRYTEVIIQLRSGKYCLAYKYVEGIYAVYADDGCASAGKWVNANEVKRWKYI